MLYDETSGEKKSPSTSHVPSHNAPHMSQGVIPAKPRSEESGSKLSLVIVSLVIILLSFASGWYAGNASTSDPFASITGSETTQRVGNDTVDFSSFWKVWKVLDEKFVQTHGATTTDDIKKNAEDADKTGSSSDLTSSNKGNSKEEIQKRIDGAIKGMVESLGDPYTVYFTPEESEEFANEIKGNFEGIGMELGIKDNILTVISALKNTPAERAGIKAGDKVLKINDSITAGMSTDQAINLIRGKKGTEVTLTLLSIDSKEPKVVKVVRDVINIPTIDSQLRNDGVFVIRLFSFTAESANLFRKELRKFVESNSDKLILDLRGNPGGYLDAAVDMASWFLPQGSVVVRENHTPISMLGNTANSTASTANIQKEEVLRSKGYDIFSDRLKMVILIDGGSASASEILAGALQEYGVAKLVGTQSFGKGSVQEIVPVTKNTLLKVTIARWLTPQGKSISDGGLKPDIEVKFTADDIAAKNDVQMQAAADILNGKQVTVTHAASSTASSTPR